jgi:hypothetical protein
MPFESVFLPPPPDIGGDLARVAAGAQGFYDMRQKALAQRATKGLINPEGDFDAKTYYQRAAELGLDPEHARAAMQWRASQLAAQADAANKAQAFRAQGYDPQSTGRNNAQYGEPAPQYVPRQQEPAAAKLTPEALHSYLKGQGNLSKTVAAAEPTDQIAAQTSAPSGFAQGEQMAPAPTGQEVQVTGQQAQTSGGTQLPEADLSYAQSAQTLVPGEDRRDFLQKFEDSYDPASGMGAQAAQPLPTQTDPMFQWEPQNDGSNQFQQFSAALNSKLKAEGYNSPSELLQATYANAIKANAPTMPNEALLMLGPDGLARYQGEMQTYMAGIQKAQGIAGQEVAKVRAGLSDYAKQVGVNTVEQSKSEIPGGLLRDPAKRTEAAALITNQQNVENASEAVKASVDANGPNVMKLMLAAPQVIRAYATALNPGQQLGEGNLLEVSKVMYPELPGPKLIPVVAALGRGLRNNDWSGFKTISDAIDATAPQALYQRMSKLTEEAAKLNQISLASYVKQPEKPKLTKETLGGALGMKAKPGTIKAPIDLSTGVEPAIGEYYIHKGKVMRREK